MLRTFRHIEDDIYEVTVTRTLTDSDTGEVIEEIVSSEDLTISRVDDRISNLQEQIRKLELVKTELETLESSR